MSKTWLITEAIVIRAKAVIFMSALTNASLRMKLTDNAVIKRRRFQVMISRIVINSTIKQIVKPIAFFCG
ncbi:hypothetical protein BLX24_08245 [Arsenicibacter rosenii]|uniref:Uncharacterized protein n=1 Tax=Arsenicibacter rosenii TaxID=1750698 RepID=A0A1S2VM63_9BACT|nr:hypothetical protein BLX24_08245 [Arsenicibacter rosenii]